MSGGGTKIEEARTLLGYFTRSDCASLYVRVAGGVELFVSRAPAHANPMVAAAAAQVGDASVTQNATTGLPEEASIHAPHLGTLTNLAAVGTTIAVGDTVATLELLGEPIAIVSDRAGAVRRRLGQIGSLVEFDQPLIALA